MTFRRTAIAGAAVSVLAAVAIDRAAAAAERRHPPKGTFINVDSVSLHVVERGVGDPIVYLHGNGSMFEEVDATGLVETLASSHRMVVFDRPGFGHSSRPKDVTWTPERQADLIASALVHLGIQPATLIGHSWGTLVALAMAMRHPKRVRGLVLCSGYYFPEPRRDLVLAAPAIPIVGDALRYTVSPIAGWLLWHQLVGKIFAPNSPTARFNREFPKAMALRPSQLRAAAEEVALMMTSAERLSHGYSRVACPAIILAGDADKIVATDLHSRKLPDSIPQAQLRIIEGVGHMLPHFETRAIIAAVDEIGRSDQPSGNYAHTLPNKLSNQA